MAPGVDEMHKQNEQARGLGFDIAKDSKVNVDLLNVAKTLDSQVEMSEFELRELLKKVFTTVPTYHIQAVTRLIKKGEGVGKMDRLASKVGGLMS